MINAVLLHQTVKLPKDERHEPQHWVHKANMNWDVFTHQQKEGCEEHPACFEIQQHFAAPGGAVADHIKDVLTELVDP